MPSQLLPLSSQVEFGEVLGDAAAIQYESAPDRLGWFVCFFSFCMLLLISWSASRPGDWTTTIVVLLFLLPWGWIILRGPDEAFRALVVNWPLLLLPLLTVASTLWSDYPSITLRSGTQYLITICIGIWAGYCIKPRTLLAALLSALALVAVLSVLDGRGQYDALTGEYALVGLFGSKNYFAVCLSFLLLTAIAVTFDRAQAIPFRIIGLGSATLAIPLLIYAHSVGALVISVFASLVFFALHLIVRLPIRSRIAVLSVALVVAAMLVVIAAFDLNYANILEFAREGCHAYRTNVAMAVCVCRNIKQADPWWWLSSLLAAGQLVCSPAVVLFVCNRQIWLSLPQYVPRNRSRSWLCRAICIHRHALRDYVAQYPRPIPRAPELSTAFCANSVFVLAVANAD